MYFCVSISNSENANTFHVTQGILTPDTDYLLKNLNSELGTLAATAGHQVVEWLRTDAGHRNIIIIDFAVKMVPQFSQTVIQMNDSLLQKYNI